MSLFKTKQFWLTQCGTAEQFENTSLLVTRLNSEHDYIITGSHSGYLRIYQPSTEKQEDGSLVDYKPTDLLIEIRLGHPILQMATGKLVSGSQILQLAILHPRSVGVYSFVSKVGIALHGHQNNVLLVYEHSLRRSTANLVIGPFGGTQNRDFICVQSLDGMLSFFEQETFSFCCFLPNFLLPGPLVFVKNTDSFVTSTSSWCIENYRYKRLSEIGQNTNQSDADGIKFEADWSYNLGESVLDLIAVSISVGESVLMVLGERNLFCLGDSGKLRFMKRFDFSPHCFQPYFLEPNNKLMSIVIAETNTLLLYENVTLRWSAQLPVLPVAISRGAFVNLRGTIVLLTEDGMLQGCYLGTEPMLFTAPPLKNQELNFEEAEQQLTALNKIIKSNRLNDLASSLTHTELIVNLTVDSHLVPSSYETISGVESPEMCNVSLTLVPNAPFDEVQVALEVEKPFRVTPNLFFTTKLEETVAFESHVYIYNNCNVASLMLKAIVTHITTTGVPRVLMKTCTLPLKMAVGSCQSVKESTHKITLNVNQQAPPLSVIFPEYAGENSNSNLIGFKNLANCGSSVTILLAKSSQRYRLQSDDLASLNILVNQLISRMKKHFESTQNFAIKHSSALPTEPFLELVEDHYNKRLRVTDIQTEINDLSTQLRFVQKRLIAKFKAKNPSPLNNLDVLMNDTHSELLDALDRLETATADLEKSQCELTCGLKLLEQLISCSDVSEEALSMFQSMFVSVFDLEDQSWEDIMDISLTYLLRTVLAKSEKDRIKNAEHSMERVKDISRFKKKFSLCLERMVKGGAFVENDENVDEDVPLQQLGKEIADLNIRARSSKGRVDIKPIVIDDDDDVVENV